MDINKWNAVFVIIGMSVVCSGCMIAQSMSQLEGKGSMIPTFQPYI